MKILLTTAVLITTLTGCSAKYSYYTLEGQNQKWKGPYDGQHDPSLSPPVECNQVAFYGPHTVRIHNETTGEVTTHDCHQLKKTNN